MSAWRKANPEENKARGIRYRATHPERVKAANSRKYFANREERMKQSVKWRKNNPYRYLLIIAKNRALRAGLEFRVTVEDIVWPETCPISGVTLLYGGAGKAPSCASLDRIDNTKGYVPGNVAVVSLRMNFLKRNGALWEFEAITRYMRAHGVL